MSVSTQREAEAFLRKVWTEYPHLIKLGGQAILDGTVAGMERLSPRWSAENLTEATFLAGLRHAFDLGILPKPTPPGPTPEELAAEQERRAAQEEAQRLAERDKKREALWNKQQFGSRRHDHSKDIDPNEPKETASARAQLQAEERCKNITGRSHAETLYASRMFVMAPDKVTVDWVSTENKRLQYVKGNLRTVNYRY